MAYVLLMEGKDEELRERIRESLRGDELAQERRERHPTKQEMVAGFAKLGQLSGWASQYGV